MWGRGDMSPGKALDTPVSPQVCHPLDEANPEGPRPRHLHQTAGGGEGEEGQLRPRGEAPASPSLCPAHHMSIIGPNFFKTNPQLGGAEVDPSKGKAATWDRKSSWLFVVWFS